MRILLVNNLFHPEPNYLKGIRYATELKRRGHDVHVLTGYPSYPAGVLYAGYRVRWTLEETIEGIPVTRVAMYPSHDASGLRRALSYMSVALSEALHAPALRKDFEICHAYLGPVTLMWPAVLVRALTGAKIIADVQDIWPESVTNSGMLKSRHAARVLEQLSRWSYRQADALIALSPGYKRALVDRGIAEEAIRVIYNWCDESSLDVPPAALPPAMLPGDSFNVVYAGNIGKLQGLDTVVDSAKRLREVAPDVRFVLVGGGLEAERLKQRIVRENISNVSMVGPVPLAQANEAQRMADVLLVHLEPSPLTRIGIPSKVQAYLACGRPVLVAAEGDAAALLERSGGGLTCRPRDPEALAGAVMKLRGMAKAERDRLGQSGSAFYRAELSFQRGVDAVEALFREVLAGKSARSASIGGAL